MFSLASCLFTYHMKEKTNFNITVIFNIFIVYFVSHLISLEEKEILMFMKSNPSWMPEKVSIGIG